MADGKKRGLLADTLGPNKLLLKDSVTGEDVVLISLDNDEWVIYLGENSCLGDNLPKKEGSE